MKFETRGRPRLIEKSELEEWKQQHGEKFDDPKAIRFIQSLLQQGIIKNNEVIAAHLLHISATSRINSCKYKQGIYKAIECGWDDPQKMTLDIITRKSEMWKLWNIQTAYFEQSKEQSDRPSIDRINEKLGYSLDNIQMLSLEQNISKARRKSHFVFDVSDVLTKQGAIPSFRKFDTKQAAVESLGIKFSGDTGRFYMVDGKTYLVQSADVTEGKKEIEEYEGEDESNWYTGWIPISIYTDEIGNKYTLRQQITYPQMKILIKTNDNDSVKEGVE